MLSGTPGVGKTALAVHWAHRVADRFPDGQLYVNLRGFDAGMSVSPADALRGFLTGLGLRAPQIPDGTTARAALYRSLVSGRRVLVLLDNAGDADHVRPLLPGSATCFVLATSRNQMPGLVASAGATPVLLDVLTPTEARRMLAARLGKARVEAEGPAADEIAERCARLPLALAIAIARAANHPEFSLGALAEEFRDGGNPFELLGTGDTATDVRAAFSWSYRLLTPAAARLFRLLGTHAGPDISAAAAASLAGLPPSETRESLAELARANLLTERLPGRYAFHDLLRAWAGELCRRTDPEAERRAATRRCLDHYLHTAVRAALAQQPHRRPIEPVPAVAGTVPESVTDLDAALAWFNAEDAVLLSVIHQAADLGYHAHTWQLVWAVGYYLHRVGHWHDWASIARTAVLAARQLDDSTGEGYARRGLGRALTLLNYHDEAMSHPQAALTLAVRSGDRIDQAFTHHHLAQVRHGQARYQEALDHTRRALVLHQAAGDRVGEGTALNNLAWYHTELGQYEQAVDYCRQARAVHQKTGDRDAAAATWDSEGHAYQRWGRYRQAVGCYRWAARLAQDLGQRYREASTLSRLGDTHHAAGQLEAACGSWQQAVRILDDLAHPEGEQVRARLESTCHALAAGESQRTS